MIDFVVLLGLFDFAFADLWLYYVLIVALFLWFVGFMV